MFVLFAELSLRMFGFRMSCLSRHNASDRLFISSSAVAVDAAGGVPPDASATLTFGVGYSLVSVVYLIWGGAHYVTQFRLKGKWLKYECTGGGVSASFDTQWHSGKQVLYVYVRTGLQVAAGGGGESACGNSQGSDSSLSDALCCGPFICGFRL